MVEIFIAALAVFAWVNMEPGPVRSVAYNVIFIAGVSSLFFNGNPLLRYDAYYVLSDVLEIPNLGTRGIRYMLYLIQRYLLGIKQAEPPLYSQGERFWFAAYTISSTIYRLFVYAAIILFVASKFFFIGVLFACVGVVNMFALPAYKAVKFLSTSPMLARTRPRAVLVTGLIVVLGAAMIGIVPVPLATLTEGVMWLPEETFVRAGTDGFVERILAEPGKPVKRGDPLVECSDPLLPAQIRLLEAQKREMEAVYDTHAVSDKVKAEIAREEIEHIAVKLEDARERLGDLTIHSSTDGIFILPMADDLPSSFVQRGRLIGYVVSRSTVSARVVVSQADVDLVRQRTHQVSVRLPEQLSKILPAELQREVPAATDQLPGMVLSQEGGGKIATDPREGFGNKAFQKIFLFDITLPSHAGIYHVGGRVHVRFDHGMEPIGFRWYRGLRQLFLKRFNV